MTDKTQKKTRTKYITEEGTETVLETVRTERNSSSKLQLHAVKDYLDKGIFTKESNMIIVHPCNQPSCINCGFVGTAAENISRTNCVAYRLINNVLVNTCIHGKDDVACKTIGRGIFNIFK